MPTFLFLTAALAQSPTEGTERQQAAIDRCLAHFDGHPFGEKPEFRVLSASVRVMGVGSPEVVDEPTDGPSLVLVEPSVSVLTKTTWKLHNPNGWYCFDANVGVLSKIVFDAACGANLADSRTGAVVIGNTETNGGVVVLGDVEVKRDCAKAAPTPASTAPAPTAPAPTDATPVEAIPAAEPEPAPKDKPKGYVH